MKRSSGTLRIDLAQYREMERRSAALQAKLGFVPDIEDWEEYE